MRIKVIIPSFNQAKYLEETLRSVLEQSYPDLELMVLDGGSPDGSVDILRKYESRLAYWVSEPDHGQSDAINKGLTRVTGDVWMCLNSDDLLTPGALAARLRLVESLTYSHAILLHARGIAPQVRSRTQRLLRVYESLFIDGRARRFDQARRRGQDAAIREIQRMKSNEP